MPSSSPEYADPDTLYVVSDGQITSQLGDESIILELNEGIYYGLDQIGTRVWELLQAPRSIRQICEAIRQDYDVSTDACIEAVAALVADLEARTLVKQVDEAPPHLS